MRKVNISEPKLLKDEINNTLRVLKSSKLSQGELVEEFESSLADYCNTKHAISVNSGTAALHTILMSLNLKKDDEVITSPFTFISTANTILASGGKIKFCDINLEDYTLDTNSILKSVTNRTKAVINVDLYGHPGNYQIKLPQNIATIADGCQALGSQINKQKVGSMAKATAFSFYATKNITSGEGGAITTNDDQMANFARSFINHGQIPGEKYNYQFYGLNYRMTNISAAMLIPQLNRIDDITESRRKNAETYNKLLSECIGIVTPKVGVNVIHSWHQYTIRINNNYPLSRERLLNKLNSQGIYPGIYYPKPLYLAPHLRKFVSKKEIFPNTETACSQVLSLPVHPNVKQKDIEIICKIITSLQK